MTPTFLGPHDRPLLTNMIITETPEECIITAKNAIYDGADAFGIQMERLLPQYRTEENYKKIFQAMGKRPIYITSYREASNTGFTDEQCMEYLADIMAAGATLCDIMGDTFDPTPGQMTYNPEAVDKQMAFIERMHAMGKEVLMSSHVCKYLKIDEVMKIALAQKERGADIAKIVTAADNEDEEMDNLNTTHILKKELGIPFLFLSGGTHNKLHRTMGPLLGCCMYLVVQQHDRFSAKMQPVLRAAKQIRDHVDIY